MPATRSRSSAERAEARRRARQVARGEEPLIDVVTTAEAPTTSGATPPRFFTRLFPPAPPLPGKGDPLAGFTYTGRFRGVVGGAWLLAKHPLAWGVAGVGWAVLQFGLQVNLALSGSQSVLAFAITLGQYALLIGAGWFGWWRPWAFGLAAGVLGVLLFFALGALLTIQSGDALPAGFFAAAASVQLLLYSLVGTFAGFYGGYLRRRMATPAPSGAKGRRR